MDFKPLDRFLVRPGWCGAAVRALALAASLALAAAGLAAEPLPAGQTAQPVAPPGSTALPQGAGPPPGLPSPGRTLRDVVNAIEGRYGIRIWMDGAVSGTAPSDVDPTGLPAEVALRQAFKGYDLFLHYKTNPETDELEVTRAWAFPRSRGDSLQVLGAPAAAAPGLESADLAQRALELLGLSVRPGTDPRDAFLAALANPDESVRQQALMAAQASGLPLPIEALEGLMLNDASEAVRMSAMDLLTMTPETQREAVRAALERVTRDPSPVIRDHAAALLSALTSESTGAAAGSGTWAVPELDTVMRDLQNGDENVRQQALMDAQAYGLSVAPENIEWILKYDASEAVRVIALNALAANPEIGPERMQALLEYAARDASPLVREQASVLLGTWNPLTDVPAEPGPDDLSPQPPDNASSVDIPAGDGSGEGGNSGQ